MIETFKHGALGAGEFIGWGWLAYSFVFMKASPMLFYKAETDAYIHVLQDPVTDTGITVPSKANVYFIECDKCLRQMHKGMDGMCDPELQLMIAALSDINDPLVRERAKDSPFMTDIINELRILGSDEEVQSMILTQQLEIMDYNSNLEYARDESIKETQINNIKSLMKTLGLSVEKAMDSLEIPENLRSVYAHAVSAT